MKLYIKLLLLIIGVNAYSQTLIDTIYQQPITATKAFQGQFGSATLQIDDAGSDGLITKPLIIAEGFDSGLLGAENEFGENQLEDFIDDIQDSNSLDLRNLLTGGTEFDFGDQDYDIIYVNWDSPRAQLQLNALVLEEVITWVNQEKEADAEQNVVLGQSMGGVIARYALANMEQDNDPNTNHDAKLYISHDAPHQGANIPIGIQYFARHLADQFIGTPLGDFSFEVSDDSEASIQEINALFNEPGTQQLLSNYITPNFGLDNSANEAWQTDLQSKGYPTLTRNIAISNGSHCANTQEYDYNASLFRMNGNARTGVLTDLLGSFLGIADDIALAVIFDEPALLLGVLPGSSRFDLDFNAKALPRANNSANIYKGKVSYTKKLFWFINITVNLTNRSYNNPVNLSYDKYAGGRYELFRGIDPIDYFDDDNVLIGDDPITQFQADLLNALVGSANINFDVEQTFGFIPTPSALDVGNGNTDLDDDDYFRVYNAANPPSGDLDIPFDNFITAYFDNNSLNEQHISFNFRNGTWLATELDEAVGNEDIFDCSAFCSNAEIIGEDVLCTTGTYSVTDQATTAAWTVIDPNNLVSFSTSGTDIVLNQLNPDQFGIVTLEVTYGSPRCGEATASTDIEVGILPYHLNGATLTGETSVCDSQQYTYYISGFNHPCADDVDWTVSDNLNIISHTSTSVTVTSNIFNDEYAGLITANLPNSSFTIEKGVWVGVPNNDNLHIQKIGAYDLYAGRWSKLKASYQTLLYPANGPLNLTFEWQIPNSYVRNYTDTAYKDVKPYNPGQINIGVRAVCECGNSDWKYRLFDVGGTSNTITELIPVGGN